MDEIETLSETNEFDSLEGTFYNLPDIEAPPIAHEHELGAMEVGEKDVAESEKGELQVFDAANSSKEALAEAIGGEPENWQEVNSGSGQWVFDGEKIFNPSTNEEYSGVDSEKSAAVQEEAVRQWNEGGGTHIVIPGHKEETSDGVIVHAFQLILGERREDGFRDVQWTWHQTEFSNLKQENEQTEEDTDRHGQSFSSESESNQLEASEQINVGGTALGLENAHEALVDRPETTDTIASELITLDAQTLTVPVPFEAANESVSKTPNIDVPSIVIMNQEFSLAAFLKGEPIAPEATTPIVEKHHEVAANPIATESPTHSHEPALEVAVMHVGRDESVVEVHSIESAPTPEHDESLQVLAPEAAAHVSTDSSLESLPVFVPGETSTAPNSAVQTMYDALILSFSKDAAEVTSALGVIEATSAGKFGYEPDAAAKAAPEGSSDTGENLQPTIADTSEGRVTGTGSSFDTKLDSAVPAPTEKVTDDILNTLLRNSEIRIPKIGIEPIDMKTEPTEIRVPKTKQSETRPASAERERLPVQEERISLRSVEIASRVLGLRFGPDAGEPVVLHGNALQFKIEDSVDESGPRERTSPFPELNGIKMVSLSNNLRV